ncbi:hypothetical protein [Mycolicibacterium mengxianglii]|uniref:hypothetical protein n=1 Tax=Mycolicibacterium mengxianglii TaxID=2736649 RepID=UPI0018EF0CC8|nr:hypothetical protein [Mycolicibacterium mengxianglii]
MADYLLSHTGAGWPHCKDVVVSVDWLSSMRWGLDHFVFVMCLIRGGRLTAATLSARMFLERWTLNVAHHHGVEQREGETDAEFITRTWQVYPDISDEHDMGTYWKLMSEHLHGRAALENALLADGISVPQFLVNVAEVTLLQVLGSIGFHAEANGLGNLTTTLFKSSAEPRDHSSWTEDSLIVNSLYQMDFQFTFSEIASELSRIGERYRQLVGDRGSGPMWRDTLSLEQARLAFLERRGRAIDTARASFEHEIEYFGDDFEPGTLNARLFRYIGIAELARLVAGEAASDYERQALSSAADALDSAWYVWLEDTDLSLGCLRVLLEQTSRARAHRLKGNRAETLENLAVAAAPTRWLELAGYRRLASYNRALGQFAHIRETLRLPGARTLLERLQADPGDDPQFTARGDALNEAAYLLAHELGARVDASRPWLADLFRDQVTLKPSKDHESSLVDMLERSLGHRDSDLGPNVFHDPLSEDGERE